MITLLTSANKNFKNFIDFSIELYRKYDYKFEIYNLGDLGIGKEFTIENTSFQTKGYYCEIKPGWNSTALHKPDVILDCIQNSIEEKNVIVYLDSDAIVYNPIDEIQDIDFDIGVTIRSPNENMYWYINAGVFFIRKNERSIEFLNKWKHETRKMNNDQLALNSLINPNNILLTRDKTYFGTELGCHIPEIKIHCFPTWSYNFYYFGDIDMKRLLSNDMKEIKILHFKTDKRDYFKKFIGNNNEKVFCWMKKNGFIKL